MDTVEQTLANLLLWGKLEELALGLSLFDILEYLGPPDNYSTVDNFLKDWPRLKASTGTKEIIAIDYAQLELIFHKEDSKLICFWLEPKRLVTTTLPGVLDDRLIGFISNMSITKFSEFAFKRTITCYLEYHSYKFPKVSLLCTQKSSVRIVFDLEDNADELYAITKSVWMDNYWHLME